MVSSKVWGACVVALLVAVAGCAGTPVSLEQRRMVERQLVQPFLQNTKVVCNELEVEITPNFHLHVSNPGVDKSRQRFDLEQKDAMVEKVWSNLTGDRAGWFTVTIAVPKDPTDVSGKVTPHTTFTVMNQFTLRIRERGELTFAARAKGAILLVEEAGSKPRDVREFAIVNGVVGK